MFEEYIRSVASTGMNWRHRIVSRTSEKESDGESETRERLREMRLLESTREKVPRRDIERKRQKEIGKFREIEREMGSWNQEWRNREIGVVGDSDTY